MKRLLITVLCILLLPVYGISQGDQAVVRAKYFDEVKHAPDDSSRMIAFLNLGYHVYAGSKPDSAIYYYDRAFAIAKRLNNIVGKMRYYACYGDILSAQSKNYEAIKMALKAVALAETTSNDRIKGAAYNNIAGAYTDVHDLEKGYAYYLKAITSYEKLNDKKHLAAVYANVLGIFSSVGHSPERALEYGLKAIAVSRQLDDKLVLGEALLNTSYVYVTLGRLHQATALLDEAVVISKKANDQTSLLAELAAYNRIYILENKYAQLKQNSDQISRLAVLTGNGRALACGDYYLGIYNLNLKNYKVAQANLQQAIALGRKNGDAAIEQNAYSALGDVQLLLNDFNGYHHSRSLEDSVRDKIHADQILINTQELEAKYNISKKEVEISDLNKEKQIQALTLQRRTSYLTALMLAVVALVIMLWLLRSNSIRKEKLLTAEKEVKEQQIQLLEKEKELLLAQALMKGQEDERTRLAKDLHDGLGGILTGTKYSLSSMKQNMIITADNAAAFEKTMAMLDQSISELRRVAHNMMPESLLKLSLDDALVDYCQQVTDSGALNVHYQSFGVNDIVLDEPVKIGVYRITQELINNVVKHAGAKNAIVQITLKEEVLGITVEDDGSGFDPANLLFVDGMGYKNLKSRVDFLKGNIDVKSERGKGTSVLIQLPV